MPDPSTNDARPGLLPEGRRWGRGAQSVMPYLASTRSPAGGSAGAPDDDAIRNPVFPRMELLLPRRDH